FEAGRVPAGEVAGARNRKELMAMLKEGRIKAALVIGEDPMATDRTASYFGAIEFLAALDWAQTETTQFADVAIPGSTFLESEGTRCNFQGEVITFNPTVETPSGVKGWEVLVGIAAELGLSVGPDFDGISAELDHTVRANVKQALDLLWNTGQERSWDGSGSLVVADVQAQAAPVLPAYSMTARYRSEKLKVGLQHFRVGARV
ncbi:MAG: molybdopterin-dependent oxidoreductase, partial [Acidobacteriota bacterium]